MLLFIYILGSVVVRTWSESARGVRALSAAGGCGSGGARAPPLLLPPPPPPLLVRRRRKKLVMAVAMWCGWMGAACLVDRGCKDKVR